MVAGRSFGLANPFINVHNWQLHLGIRLEHGYSGNLPSYRSVLFRSRLECQHYRHTDCSSIRHRYVRGHQHDWLRHTNPNKTRRPCDGAYDGSDHPVWQRTFPASNPTIFLASDCLHNPAILLHDMHQVRANWIIPRLYSAEYDFSPDVRHHRTRRLYYLRLVPQNSKEEWNTLMVLRKEVSLSSVS